MIFDFRFVVTHLSRLRPNGIPALGTLTTPGMDASTDAEIDASALDSPREASLGGRCGGVTGETTHEREGGLESPTKMTGDDPDGRSKKAVRWSKRLHSAIGDLCARYGGTARPFAPGICGLGLGVIFAVDAVSARSSLSLPVAGALDECAHLATAILILAALRGSMPKAFVVGVLAGSIAIDVDHVPLVLGWRFLTEGTSRPYTHSWVSPAAAAIASGRCKSRQDILAGVAVGILTHFVRDAATGDGLALLWPMTTTSVRAPYWGYAALMIALTALSGTWALCGIVSNRHVNE